MSESQSRYSIVERLTSCKLAIMDSVLELETEIQQKENDLTIKEQNIKTWKESILNKVDNEEKLKKQEIETLKKQYEHLKGMKGKKLSSYKEKLAELDNALKSITEISKASVEQAKGG